MILREGLTMALAGAACGIVLAFGSTRLMASLLYGIRPTDPWTFTVAVLLVVGFAALAAQVPIRRALRVDPVIAMRAE